MHLRFACNVLALAVALSVEACGGGGGGGSSISAPPAEVWKGVGLAVLGGAAPVLMPEVVAVSPGLFRMYYGQGRTDGGWDLLHAESSDALNWTVGGVALAGTANPADPEFVIRGASLVHLANGQWRMYYQATPKFDETLTDPNAPPYFQIMSAISSDGVTFSREGVRIGNTHFDPNSILAASAHARVIQLNDGSYAAYVSGRLSTPNSSGLYLCGSSDGLTFHSPQLILSGHDPYVVKLNGEYLLYFDASPPQGSSFTGEELASSSDGMTWSAPSAVTLEDAMGTKITQGPDVGGVIMPNGKLRLFGNSGSNVLIYDRVSP